jgi:hypothetical protein
MITTEQYFGGRRESHPTECSPWIDDNAHRTVGILNQMIARAESFGVVIPLNPEGDFKGSQLASGWRPPTINSCTPGAALNSKHMTAEAGDLMDPHGDFKAWLATPEGQYSLVDIGLWMEDPGHTPTWVHLQVKPPKSGKRTFLP